jgi:hypothetical protein
MTDFICDSIDARGGRTLLSAAFDLEVDLDSEVGLDFYSGKFNVHGSGQECPLHTDLVRIHMRKIGGDATIKIP